MTMTIEALDAIEATFRHAVAISSGRASVWDCGLWASANGTALIAAARESAVKGEARKQWNADRIDAAEAALAAMTAERDAALAEGTRLKDLVAVSYQVVGVLAEKAGVFDHPSAIRALDALSDQRESQDKPVLPFPHVAWDGDYITDAAQKAAMACEAALCSPAPSPHQRGDEQ